MGIVRIMAIITACGYQQGSNAWKPLETYIYSNEDRWHNGHIHRLRVSARIECIEAPWKPTFIAMRITGIVTVSMA